jgi:glycosyltransferase involved in cell wall biosynthesis
MNVTILSQYYSPEPIQRPVDLAGSLATMGHSVTVVTGFPHYPVGRTYPGYKVGFLKREVISGIPVIRVFEYPYHGKSVLGRVANYTSFMASAAILAPVLPRTDVLYVRHPPLTIGLAAMVISRLRRCPFVYDVQDIWPESALHSGLLGEGPMVRTMRVIERMVYRRASQVVAVTEDAKKNIVAKGIPEHKVTVLPSWVDDAAFNRVEPDLTAATRIRLGWSGRFVVMFAGNLGTVQGLDTVLDAARLLRSEAVLFALVGDGSDKARLLERVRVEGLSDCVHFLGSHEPGEMPGFYAAADALLVHLKSCELDRFVIPAKLLSYMAAGRPIVAAAGGSSARIVSDAGGGPVVLPERPAELAGAVRALMRMGAGERARLGQNAFDYAVEHHAKSKIIRSYERLLLSAC